MKTDTGGPAFPVPHQIDGNWESQPKAIYTGMSLRDYAVIAFQAALIAQVDGYWAEHADEAAERADRHADAMLRRHR